MNPPTISVIIPAYNATRTLTLCLESLAASDTQPLECLVVDDGSTDNTVEVARRFGAKILSTGGRRGPLTRGTWARARRPATSSFLSMRISAFIPTPSRDW